MPNLRILVAAARVVALIVVVGVFIKIAPTLASHAAGHTTTYSSSAAAPGARGH